MHFIFTENIYLQTSAYYHKQIPFRIMSSFIYQNIYKYNLVTWKPKQSTLALFICFWGIFSDITTKTLLLKTATNVIYSVKKRLERCDKIPFKPNKKVGNKHRLLSYFKWELCYFHISRQIQFF